MHIRTFKAQALRAYRKANPTWEVVGTEFGPRRSYRPLRVRDASMKHERERLHWRVRVRSASGREAVVAFNWGYHDGVWLKVNQ